MNILIVDDEVFTVRAMQMTIDWKKLGIDDVFTAYNAAKAREIICKEAVNLMICDIEMPQEDGLSLVSWVRENRFKVEIIFLTCHSEFDYARKALKLNVFDYAVKPVNFPEMEQTIQTLIHKINEEQQVEMKTRQGEYWAYSRDHLEKQFWEELLTRQGYATPEEIEDEAAGRGLDFDRDQTYRLALISIKKIKMMLKDWDNELLLFTVQNMAREIILEDLESNRLIQIDGKSMIILGQMDDEAIDGALQRFVDVCREYLGTSLQCYISGTVFCEELKNACELLMAAEKNDVTGRQELVFCESQNPTAQAKPVRLPGQLTELLNQGRYVALEKALKSFFWGLEYNESLNYEVLKNVQRDFLQMIFVYMEKNHIRAHQLEGVDTDQAMESVEHLLLWMLDCIQRVLSLSHKSSLTPNQQVVSHIKVYISGHLSEELSREQLARYINLSPDYLAKIFKAEEETTLSQYIADERMKEAVQLMKTTAMNVSQIAISVGCDNFSYFAKLFKKYTGYSPREYRMAVIAAGGRREN